MALSIKRRVQLIALGARLQIIGVTLGAIFIAAIVVTSLIVMP